MMFRYMLQKDCVPLYLGLARETMLGVRHLSGRAARLRAKATEPSWKEGAWREPRASEIAVASLLLLVKQWLRRMITARSHSQHVLYLLTWLPPIIIRGFLMWWYYLRRDSCARGHSEPCTEGRSRSSFTTSERSRHKSFRGGGSVKDSRECLKEEWR